MNDDEYDVLDELYFVVSYKDLKQACSLTDDQLVRTLETLFERGWVRVLRNVDEDASEPVQLPVKYDEYLYLASKKGLLAHNSN